MPDHRETRPLSALHNWEQNPRSITKEDFERLKRQIAKLGQYKPLLITEDGIVLGGNMRLRAYKELGLKEAWVSVVDAPDDKTKLEYALSDNDRAGTYDEQALAELVTNTPEIELGDYKVDLGEPVDLSALLAKFGPEPEIEEDEAPEPPAEAKSKLGEVYQLGRHRLMCGNSTDVSDIEKLLDGAQPDFVFTDPPYQLETQGGGLLKESSAMKGIRDLGIDTFDPSTLTPLAQTSVFCCNKPLVPQYIALAQKWGVSWDLCVYHKQNITPNYGGHLMTDLEYLLVLGNQAPITGQDKSLYSKLYSGGKDQDNETAWSKPVSLCAKFIQLYAKPRSIVADIFGGSGSTLIACEQTNRTCYMMELDPHYVDVIIQRWENLTGQKAVKLEEYAQAA